MAKKELNIYAVIWISTVAGGLLSSFINSEKTLEQFLGENFWAATIAAAIIIIPLILIAKFVSNE